MGALSGTRDEVRRYRLVLAAVVAVAVALRVVYAITTAPGVEFSDDDGFYHYSGRLIALGHGYLNPFPYYFEGRNVATALHPPLYPLLIAGLTDIGIGAEEGQRAVLAAVVGGAVVIAVGALGKQVGGPRAGIIAAAIAAIYPTLIAADGVLMSESLYGLFVALGLLAALRLREAGTTRSALALGLLLGLAALTRTEALGLLLALLVVLAVCMKDRRRVLVVTLAAALMLQVPWVVRNTVEFGHPVLSHNEAVVLAGTNCAAVYSGRDIGWYGFLCAVGYRPKGTEAEAAARARSHALDYARDHIRELPGVMAVRLLRVWGLYQPQRQDDLLVRNVPGTRDSHRVARAGVVLFYPLALLSLFAAVGLARRRRADLLILATPIVVTSLVVMGSWGGARLRHAAELVIIVLASLQLSAWMERRRRRRVA